ncbi:MAG: hypothetical protein ACTSXH_17215, partial [Promethearchaeota archaeon]
MDLPEIFLKCIKEKKIVQKEIKISHENKANKILRIKLIPSFDELNNLINILISLNDITEQIRRKE